MYHYFLHFEVTFFLLLLFVELSLKVRMLKTKVVETPLLLMFFT